MALAQTLPFASIMNSNQWSTAATAVFTGAPSGRGKVSFYVDFTSGFYFIFWSGHFPKSSKMQVKGENFLPTERAAALNRCERSLHTDVRE